MPCASAAENTGGGRSEPSAPDFGDLLVELAVGVVLQAAEV
jgi:hypothetical protein